MLHQIFWHKISRSVKKYTGKELRNKKHGAGRQVGKPIVNGL
jgi:hypothetical protein